MYELKINENNQVCQWWINFLTYNETGSKINDIAARFAEWNAELVVENSLGDKIIFQNEQDRTWFLLRWS